MKRNMILMAIISVMLVGGLTVIGFMYKDKNSEYSKLEDTIKNAAMGYFGEKLNLMYDGSIVSTCDLLEYKNNFELSVNGDVCTGYVVLKAKNQVYNYEPYISCNNYETKSYDKTRNNCGE